MCCVCKSYVVFAQCTASAVCHAGATTSPLIIILLFFIALLQAQCAVCVSPVLCLQCAVCVSLVLCLLNVLPAQFAVRGAKTSPLIIILFCNFSLHYCQCSVSCE